MTQNAYRNDETKLAPAESQAWLTVVVAFLDMTARSWAIEVCTRGNRIAGGDRLQSIWWEVGCLRDSAQFTAAVQAASESDLIIISLPAVEKTSSELCAWIDAWPPRRQLDEGALLALLGVRNDSGAEFFRTRDYLRTAAQWGAWNS
jgi:hypothetical protein